MSNNSDVIIVGGGVVGLTIARHLSLSGRKVSLFEKGACGQEASWAGAGVLTPTNPHRQDALHQFRDHSLKLYAHFCVAVQEESGIDPAYELCGELGLLLTENDVRIAEADVRAVADQSMPDGKSVIEVLTPESLRDLAPWLTTELFGARLKRSTAQIRNPRLMAALYGACEKAKVTIHEGTPVVEFVMEGDHVVGVRTDKERFSSEVVVLCTGAWSSQIDKRLASLMPVHPVKGQIVLLKMDERPFGPVVSRGKQYLVARQDGHVLSGSTEEPEAGFSKRSSAAGVSQLMTRAMAYVPGLSQASVVGSWAGLRPGTPDDRPYIGPVPGWPGLMAATGHYRSGLILAPATAEAVLAMLDGQTYAIDLTVCQPGRA